MSGDAAGVGVVGHWSPFQPLKTHCRPDGGLPKGLKECACIFFLGLLGSLPANLGGETYLD